MSRKRVPRTPSGQPSRSKAAKAYRAAQASYYTDETEREATATAFAARSRIYGIPPERAGDPRAGTLIGRMRIVGDITEAQYEAARTWLATRHAALYAIDAPGLPVQPREGVTGTLDEDEVATRCRASRDRYEALLFWLIQSPGYIGFPEMRDALYAFLDAQQYVDTMLPALHRALDRVDEWTRKPKRY